MKKLFLMVLFSVVVVSVVQAQTVVVEISNTMLDGKWTEERSLTWERENGAQGDAVVYTDDQVPDHNAYSRKDLQVWYVPVGENLWWKYTFSAAAEGLKGQYAIRVAVDGMLSEWVAKVIGKGRNPRSG